MCDKVKLEIKTLKLLSHPNITRLFGVIDTKTEIFLVLEYCSGRDLFELITSKGRLDEREARCKIV